jgi:glycosyltransferase A (GT-A) superfamily protein (DUF2064 family)
MTTTVVLAEPPVEGTTLADLVDPLSAAEAVELYRAMLADVCETLQRGEADVLVNYLPPEQAPVDDPESTLRDLLDAELPDSDAVRYEPQVGETHSGRVGNALTHLLENEQEETVAAVAPTAPFLRREHIGTAAMKLRTNDVVLGPAPDGRVTFAGFGEPIDFADAYAPPAVETLATRADEAGLDADFLPMTPVIERSGDLDTALSVLAARRRAGRLVPPRTAAVLDGWRVSADGVVRESE